jgi:hypothetical protein
MERFTSYFDGMEIVNAAEGVSGYNYYGFNRWGREEWGIKKIKIDETEYSYLIGTGLTNYATAWANKTSLTFKSPSQFNI